MPDGQEERKRGGSVKAPRFSAARSRWWDITERQLTNPRYFLSMASSTTSCPPLRATWISFADAKNSCAWSEFGNHAAARKYALPYLWKTSLEIPSDFVEEPLSVIAVLASRPATCCRVTTR